MRRVATLQFDLTPPSEKRLRVLIDGLSAEERRVMLNHGDEEAFCGVFLSEKREGIYTCRLCGLPLFKAGAKFESGTGWPLRNPESNHSSSLRHTIHAPLFTANLLYRVHLLPYAVKT